MAAGTVNGQFVGSILAHRLANDEQRGFLVEVFDECTLAFLVAATFALVAFENVAIGKDSEPTAEAYIEAGEVAPAINLANAAADGGAAKRDAILAAVSQAQAVAGDRRAALQSASQIGDDRMFSDTLSVVRTQPMKAPGAFGGNQADFQSVIDLITSTVAAPTWDTVGGQGSIMPFPNGVYVDPQGVVAKANQRRSHRHAGHAATRRLRGRHRAMCERIPRCEKYRSCSWSGRSNCGPRRENHQPRKCNFSAACSEFNMCSCIRTREMWCWPVPLVIGTWTTMAGWWERESNRPVLRLDDLVVILRHCLLTKDARFGCSITPTQASLSDVQEFVKESNKTPLKPGQRDAWLRQLREKLGKQEIEVQGIDPRTVPAW